MRISEADLVKDVRAFLDRVQAGSEIVIERDQQPIAVLRPIESVHRTISECIDLAIAHEEGIGSAPTLDLDFIEDMNEIVSSRKPWKAPSWD